MEESHKQPKCSVCPIGYVGRLWFTWNAHRYTLIGFAKIDVVFKTPVLEQLWTYFCLLFVRETGLLEAFP